jgi:hypothetical protein
VVSPILRGPEEAQDARGLTTAARAGLIASQSAQMDAKKDLDGRDAACHPRSRIDAVHLERRRLSSIWVSAKLIEYLTDFYDRTIASAERLPS